MYITSMRIVTLAVIFLQSIRGTEIIERLGGPVVITTWEFTNATEAAWKVLSEQKKKALDAVEEGCSVCEDLQCDFTVGFDGSPDESGESTLDSMIMDGDTLNVGAVAGLRRIKNAISVARRVLENTEHSLLVGSLATQFAKSMGFKETSLSGPHSEEIYNKWKENSCQPNFWINVSPDPKQNCGPYKPDPKEKKKLRKKFGGRGNHDTIGMVVLDENFRLASGTSSNGAKFKIPGRVGDSPIPGAGSYVDSTVGGAAATGDGDVMMRFLPSFLAVEEMRRGANPSEAAETAIRRISMKYPDFIGGIVVLRRDGTYGAACNGMEKFPFSVVTTLSQQVQVEHVTCLQNS